jgi:hypothetical protein
MLTHEELKVLALARVDVKAEYDRLSEEFAGDEAVNKALGSLIEVAENVGAATRPPKPYRKRQAG